MAFNADVGESIGRDEAEGASPGRSATPLKADTLLVFDWDDTILPTSWLERIGALSAANLRPEVQRQAAALSAACSETLNLASTLGTVIFVTNSAPGWLAQSCQLFMPQILQQVRGYQTFSKPLHAPLTFKITTFRRECRSYGNVVSVGDGDAERVASQRLHNSPDRKCTEEPRRVKSMKLVDLPTCQQLVGQHEMLQARLTDVAAFRGNLDLKVRFPLGGNASAGCTLVHFARLEGFAARSEECARTGFASLRPPNGRLPPLPHASGAYTSPLPVDSPSAPAEAELKVDEGVELREQRDHSVPRAAGLWKAKVPNERAPRAPSSQERRGQAGAVGRAAGWRENSAPAGRSCNSSRLRGTVSFLRPTASAAPVSPRDRAE